MSDYQNKTVWITGASSGIGASLAQTFSDAGANIVLSGRRIDALNGVAKDLLTPSLVLPFEVTDYSTLEAIVANAWDWKGRIDVLVNNAGISQRSLAIDTEPKVYTQLINVDLIAPIWLTQLQLSRMAEAGGAHIVAISSVAGRIGSPLRTAYSAAKHGLIGYMDALRTEVSLTHNINITNVLPGSVATDVARNALTGDGSPQNRSDANIDAGQDPMECARAIVEAVTRNVPELVLASGLELELAQLRHSDPEKLFDQLAQMGAHLAAHGVPE